MKNKIVERLILYLALSAMVILIITIICHMGYCYYNYQKNIENKNKVTISSFSKKVIKDAQEQADIFERIVPTENGYKVSDEIYPPHLKVVLLDKNLDKIE